MMPSELQKNQLEATSLKQGLPYPSTSSMNPDPLIRRKQVQIQNEYGLHLRPAGKFVQTAGQFDSEIRIRFEDREFNGKSILDLMTMAAECGTILELEAVGPDAGPALDALADLVNQGFGESKQTYVDNQSSNSTIGHFPPPTDSINDPMS